MSLCRLDSSVLLFAGSDANHAIQVDDQNHAVPGITGVSIGLNHTHEVVAYFVRAKDLQLDLLGEENTLRRRDVMTTCAPSPTLALAVTHRGSGEMRDRVQCVHHLRQHMWLDNCLDLFHRRLL